MTEAVPASKLDVFISYKREEGDVAEALASYLTTQGYDVWWDAALLAGEDFAKIVHAELVEARAVVVLWSKQARGSHWVRAEAALALANSTLINAVIDGMAFEGIPPEFSTIQAVRLGEDPATFHAEIAAAIARKGTAPSQTGRTIAEATTRLEAKVKDAEFFGVIANSTDPEDFREYLKLFGDAGQFAALARRRIATHEKTRAEGRSLWTRVRTRFGLVERLLGGAAALAGILLYLNIQPSRTEPPPQPVAETAASVKAPEETPKSLSDLAPDPTEAFLAKLNSQATLSTTTADGVSLPEVTGVIAWDGVIHVAGIPTLIGNLTFEGSDKARLIISNDGSGAQIQIDAMPILVPALGDFDRITAVEDLRGTSGFMSLTVDPATPLEALKAISYDVTLDIALAGADGRTGSLRVPTSGAGWSLLQWALTGIQP